MNSKENQIIVYQPNETLQVYVRLEYETVWLTQAQMAVLFGCSTDNVGLHLKNIYSSGELSREATTEDFSVVRKEGSRQVHRNITCYKRIKRLSPYGIIDCASGFLQRQRELTSGLVGKFASFTV